MPREEQSRQWKSLKKQWLLDEVVRRGEIAGYKRVGQGDVRRMRQIYAGYIVKLQAATMRLFDALDDNYPNWRAIRANERAIQKWLDKITDDTDEQRQILDIVEHGNWNMEDTTFKPIYDELRALGYKVVFGGAQK